MLVNFVSFALMLSISPPCSIIIVYIKNAKGVAKLIRYLKYLFIQQVIIIKHILWYFYFVNYSPKRCTNSDYGRKVLKPHQTTSTVDRNKIFFESWSTKHLLPTWSLWFPILKSIFSLWSAYSHFDVHILTLICI